MVIEDEGHNYIGIWQAIRKELELMNLPIILKYLALIINAVINYLII